MPSKIRIVEAISTDGVKVSSFVRPIYAEVYSIAAYGLKPEYFSPAIFQDEHHLQYFSQVMTSDAHQVAYLAYDDEKIVGSINLEKQKDNYELHCFYVGLDYQNRGIGKLLLRKALEFYRDKLPLRLEVAQTSKHTIEMYQAWGFTIREDLAVNWHERPEWWGGRLPFIYMELGAEEVTELKEKLER